VRWNTKEVGFTMSENQIDLFPEILPAEEVSVKATCATKYVVTQEIGLDTQLAYLKIHTLKAIQQYTLSEIATQLHVSIQTAHTACKWVRENWEVLDTEEYLKDAERLIGERIREYNKLLLEAEKGEPILIEDKASGIKTVLIVDGKVFRKVSKQSIRELMRDRREYEKMLLDIRGLFQKSQIILDKRQQTINSFSITSNHIVSLAESMDDKDKGELLRICTKYGKSPK